MNENSGKYFLSIDMEKANFQILKKYNPEIVFGAKTYEEFIGKFTESRYFMGSKCLRQILFGCLTAKRQNIMQRYYTGLILNLVIKEKILPKNSIRIYTHDELVFNEDKHASDDVISSIRNVVMDNLGFEMHVHSFRLSTVLNNAFVKEYKDGNVSFKCVKKIHFPQVYKKYFGHEITKNDLAFVCDGEKAYLAQTLDGRKF